MEQLLKTDDFLVMVKSTERSVQEGLEWQTEGRGDKSSKGVDEAPSLRLQLAKGCFLPISSESSDEQVRSRDKYLLHRAKQCTGSSLCRGFLATQCATIMHGSTGGPRCCSQVLTTSFHFNSSLTPRWASVCTKSPCMETAMRNRTERQTDPSFP